MDITCAVVGCDSKWTLSSDLYFFRVTKNKNILPLWQEVVKLDLSDKAMICSLHFKPDDIVERGEEKLLKRLVVPSYNIVNRPIQEKIVASDDDDDNEKLSTVRNTLLIGRQNDVNMKTAPQATSSYMVMTHSNLPRPRAHVEYFQHSRSIGTQVHRKTEEEISLRKKIKVLNLRIKRREEKLTYLQTVFKMIKKNVKGTEMAYKLSCELENISNNPEIDEIFSKEELNLKEENPVRNNNHDDEMSNDEEFVGYDEGTFVEVALSPNLRRTSNLSCNRRI